MELLAGAAAAAWSGGELFSYNRENYMFDKDMASDGVGSIVLAWKLVVSCSFKPHVTIPSDLHWISRWADGRWVVRSF